MSKLTDLLLTPVSWGYGAATALRNHLFNIKSKPTVRFTLPVICVGNLSVGGTGKTPFTEYITKLLAKNTVFVGIVSRGYGRKTKGFRLADAQDTPQTIGDEPTQYIKNLSDKAAVAVGENRPLAITSLLQLRPQVQAIVMDDGFQHRYVTPSLAVVLTTYQSPFFEDKMLPVGRLREYRSGAARAGVIIVTKCPDDMPKTERNKFREQIARYTTPGTPVFFSGLKYGEPQPVFNPNLSWPVGKSVILISGLARPQVLEDYAKSQFKIDNHLTFADHYHYTATDFEKIADEAVSKQAIILTTEKDAVKWQVSQSAKNRLADISFYLPLQVAFLEEAAKFDNLITEHVIKFS